MGQQMTAQNNSAAHLATVHLPQAGWEGHPSRLPAPRLAYGELGGAGCGVRPLLRCVWSFLQRSPRKYLYFPAKLLRPTVVIPECPRRFGGALGESLHLDAAVRKTRAIRSASRFEYITSMKYVTSLSSSTVLQEVP